MGSDIWSRALLSRMDFLGMLEEKEKVMIELTEQQMQAVAESQETPPTVMDPRTKTAYVLIRKDLYEKLTGDEYDDSPWTAEERDILAWEAGKHAGWEEMSEYDDDVEQP
jgi:hypothetical protein